MYFSYICKDAKKALLAYKVNTIIISAIFWTNSVKYNVFDAADIQ